MAELGLVPATPELLQPLGLPQREVLHSVNADAKLEEMHRHERQCAMKSGMVASSSMVRVTPPRMNCRTRE
jgi:hypothetical protein